MWDVEGQRKETPFVNAALDTAINAAIILYAFRFVNNVTNFGRWAKMKITGEPME